MVRGVSAERLERRQPYGTRLGRLQQVRMERLLIYHGSKQNLVCYVLK